MLSTWLFKKVLAFGSVKYQIHPYFLDIAFSMQVTFLSDDNVAISFGEYTNGYEKLFKKLIRRSI